MSQLVLFLYCVTTRDIRIFFNYFVSHNFGTNTAIWKWEIQIERWNHTSTCATWQHFQYLFFDWNCWQRIFHKCWILSNISFYIIFNEDL